jgi:hypothetical protein
MRFESDEVVYVRLLKKDFIRLAAADLERRAHIFAVASLSQALCGGQHLRHQVIDRLISAS